MNTELEEAAYKYSPEPEEEYSYDQVELSTSELSHDIRQAFIKGAKWYAQQLINQLDED